jgi:hypothetical protein
VRGFGNRRNKADSVQCRSMPQGRRTGAALRSNSARSTSEAVTRWQDETISRFRRLIEEADPAAVEAQKWKKPSNPEGVPVWSHDGIVCIVQELKNRVRLTLPRGASLKDPKKVFNACLTAGSMRGIDIYEGDEMDREAIKTLIRAAVTLNSSESQRSH